MPKGIFKKLWRIIAFTFKASVVIGFLAVMVFLMVISVDLPDVTDQSNLVAPQSTQILDRNGNLLYMIHGGENREEVAYEDFSPNLISATLAIEDDNFWNHMGFDPWALGKAALYEVFGVGVQRGGSTLTQQYIKNAFLTSEKTYTRKLKEIILAVRLERAFSKEEILALYLNRIPYGNNAHGAEVAAHVYFNKSARDLSVAESAILAALPQAPSRYNPYGTNKYSHLLKGISAEELQGRSIKSEADLSVEEFSRGLIGSYVDVAGGNKIYISGRSDLVVNRMFDEEMISEEEKDQALKELHQLEFTPYKEDIEHPHFVLYIKEILEEKYGSDVLQKGGLKVYTTLDPELQDYAEEVAEEKGEINLEKYGADNLAILSVDPKTGQILAMVGSLNYFDENIDGNVNVVTRPRQPGSSFKPIVYSQAFYNGYGPANVIYDVPTTIDGNQPQNYDGKFMGHMTIREALAQSRNIPAIKAYYLAGEKDPIMDLAERMGIYSLDRENIYGYALALGAGEVSLMEMVTAYSVFANSGHKPEITGILRVENNQGEILEEWQPREFDEVLDPQIAYLINNILSDRTNSVGRGLFVDDKVNAAKTGTSTKESKNKGEGSLGVRPGDAWTIGYTPSIVTGVWVGNTDGSGMDYKASGYVAAAPIFKAVMTKALENTPAEPFPIPAGIKKALVSAASGMLPSSYTPSSFVHEEIFSTYSYPRDEERVYYSRVMPTIEEGEEGGEGGDSGEAAETAPSGPLRFTNTMPVADMFDWQKDIWRYYSGSEGVSSSGQKVY